MQARLGGKSAVVTGSSSGIGRAIARAFAREGARVTVHYCSRGDAAEELAAAIREDGGEAQVLRGDLSEPGAGEELVARAWERWGRVDIWVNNAGADILTGAHAAGTPGEKLHRLLEVDLLGTVRCCWLVAPRMREAGGGAILNMSWDMAAQDLAGPVPEIFAAVKGGIASFGRCLARSYAPEVRVNDLAPGWIETAFAREELGRERYRRVAQGIPLRRMGTPEEVAAAALYLASDEAAYVTGQSLRVNGGAF